MPAVLVFLLCCLLPVGGYAGDALGQGKAGATVPASGILKSEPADPRETTGDVVLLQDGLSDAVIVLEADAPTCLRYAARDFVVDGREATGRTLQIVDHPPTTTRAVILVAAMGQSRLLDELDRQGRVNLSGLRGKVETFRIIPVANPFPGVAQALLVAGSDSNGAMYGVYELSERAFGTDPLKHWTDFIPDHKDTVVWRGGLTVQESPSFPFRGLFINDEDCLIGWKGQDPTDMVIEEDVYAQILETTCRLKGNLIAPAVYAKYMTPTTRRIAYERGLYYTASHLEVLLSNPIIYWKEFCLKKWGKEYDYSYTLYPDKLRAFWSDSIERNKQYRNIWPVGLKGANDFAFWDSDPNAPKTMEERADVVNRALHDQLRLLETALGKESKVITTLTMREEVLDLYNTGRIQLPGNVILVWDDDGSKAVMRQLPEGQTQMRDGGNGAYYHVAYCDNQWVQWVPLEVIREEFGRISKSGAGRYALFNVGDIRESVLSIKAAMELVWQSESWINNPAKPKEFLSQWTETYFGQKAASRAAKVYETYYKLEYPCRSTSVIEGMISHTTAMALNDDVWNPVSSIDWVRSSGMPELLGWYARTIHFDHFKGRLGPKLSASHMIEVGPQWDALYQEALETEKMIPESRRQFFFDNVILHVQSSRLVNHWANASLKGFSACAAGNYEAAAKLFDEAAGYMDTIFSERQKACHGKWENWFRGEYNNVWISCPWSLKPDWHAKDSRELAEIARKAAAGQLLNAVVKLTPSRGRFVVNQGKEKAVRVEFDVAGDTLRQAAEVRLFLLVTEVESDGKVKVALNGRPLPDTRLHAKEYLAIRTVVPHDGIAELKLDLQNLKEGRNVLEFSLGALAPGATAGYSVESLGISAHLK